MQVLKGKKLSTVKEDKDWFQSKGYLHFDYSLYPSARSAVVSKVTNPEFVATYPFYPFITFQKIKYKTLKNSDGTKFLDKTGRRDLCYAAHMDAQIYSYYSHLLSDPYEKNLEQAGISKNVIAFRKLKCALTGESKSNIHFAKDAFAQIAAFGECDVYAFDIQKFFDSLDRKILKKMWLQILGLKELPDDHYAVFKAITSNTSVSLEALNEMFGITEGRKKEMRRICSPDDFRDKVKKTHVVQKNVGIPQGSAISATLANLYMLNFDIQMNELVTSLGGFYLRYCDDILFILPPGLSIDVELIVKNKLSDLSLKLNEKKTDFRKFRINEGKLECNGVIQYLGFIFNGRSIAIRPQSISKFRRTASAKIQSIVRSHRRVNNVRLQLGNTEVKMRRKKIILGYTHHGKQNFQTYGHRAARIMNSDAIKSQLHKLDKFVFNKISAK